MAAIAQPRGSRREEAEASLSGRCAQMLGVSEGALQCRSIGVARFSHAGQTASLNLFWLHIYGGGLWLPVCDQTNGKTTYDGGRYLFDTTNGANLGWPLGSLSSSKRWQAFPVERRFGVIPGFAAKQRQPYAWRLCQASTWPRLTSCAIVRARCSSPLLIAARHSWARPLDMLAAGPISRGTARASYQAMRDAAA